MTDKELLRGLKNLIAICGIAEVAVRLKYRDTGAIAKWVREDRIPDVRKPAVEALIQGQK